MTANGAEEAVEEIYTVPIPLGDKEHHLPLEVFIRVQGQ